MILEYFSFEFPGKFFKFNFLLNLIKSQNILTESELSEMVNPVIFCCWLGMTAFLLEFERGTMGTF